MAIELKKGILRDGGIVGNINNGVIRKGGSSNPGGGTVLGNVKDCIVRRGSASNPGGGTVIGNVKAGVIRKGSASSPGSGSTIGKVKDIEFKGSSDVAESEAVAMYHFLIKNVF